MLPEYTFKQKFYKVVLMGNKSGKNVEGLALLFQQAKYPPSLHRDWRHLVGKAVVIAEWNNLNESIAFAAIKALRNYGASPDFAEYEKLTVFENEVLAYDFPKRHKAGIRVLQNDSIALKQWEFSQIQFANDWYSGALKKMEEYSLELWARAEAIEEAYRLTILPSFQEPQVIRIYNKDHSFHLVYKVGQPPFSNKTIADNHVKTSLLEPQVFETLTQFMDEEFWASETWYSWYGYGVLDGTKLLFEGWKNGQYKFLDDHSPKENAISWQARLLFEKIKTQAISSLGNSE
jgi:hypothetical protein